MENKTYNTIQKCSDAQIRDEWQEKYKWVIISITGFYSHTLPPLPPHFLFELCECEEVEREEKKRGGEASSS